MTGCCWACAAMTFALIYSNWALRSGCFAPSSALRLNWRENPSFTNAVRTVSALIGCPISVSVAASFSVLFDTQINGRMGSPSVAGSTSRSSAGISPGSFSQTERRPPPARRTRPFGRPGNRRDQRQAASTRCPHLGCREQPPPPLVEPRANHVPSQPNASLVDHATDLPWLAENRNPRNLSQSDASPPIHDSVIVRSVLSAPRHRELGALCCAGGLERQAEALIHVRQRPVERHAVRLPMSAQLEHALRRDETARADGRVEQH